MVSYSGIRMTHLWTHLSKNKKNTIAAKKLGSDRFREKETFRILFAYIGDACRNRVMYIHRLAKSLGIFFFEWSLYPLSNTGFEFRETTQWGLEIDLF